VAENTRVSPVNYTDANGLPHFIHAVAALNRDAQALITDSMLQDMRRVSRALHGNREGGTLHAVATQRANGFMSVRDKTKLDRRRRYSAGVIYLRTGDWVFHRHRRDHPVL